MDRAGVVDSRTQGLLVLRAFGPDPPAIGATVVNERLNRVGTIVDVFGPVDRPYLAVDPDDDTDDMITIGDRLYIR